jgi:hypothetical protein
MIGRLAERKRIILRLGVTLVANPSKVQLFGLALILTIGVILLGIAIDRYIANNTFLEEEVFGDQRGSDSAGIEAD